MAIKATKWNEIYNEQRDIYIHPPNEAMLLSIILSTDSNCAKTCEKFFLSIVAHTKLTAPKGNSFMNWKLFKNICLQTKLIWTPNFLHSVTSSIRACIIYKKIKITRLHNYGAQFYKKVSGDLQHVRKHRSDLLLKDLFVRRGYLPGLSCLSVRWYSNIPGKSLSVR